MQFLYSIKLLDWQDAQCVAAPSSSRLRILRISEVNAIKIHTPWSSCPLTDAHISSVL